MEIIEQDHLFTNLKELQKTTKIYKIIENNDNQLNLINKIKSVSWKVYTLKDYIYFGLGTKENKLIIVKLNEFSEITLEKKIRSADLIFKLITPSMYNTIIFKNVKVFYDSKILHDESLNHSLPWLKHSNINISWEQFKMETKNKEWKRVPLYLFLNKSFYGLKSYLISEIIHCSSLKYNDYLDNLSENEIKHLYDSICTIIKLARNLDGISKGFDGEHGEFLKRCKVFKQTDKNTKCFQDKKNLLKIYYK